jgi:MHS family proline/betaine transporter-like MFS transporter
VKINFAQTRRVIAAGMIGNVLEWYDFSVYGFFATAIGQAFFSGGSGTPEGALYGGRFGLQHIPRGGLTPLVALWLVERTGDEIAPVS